MNQLLEDDPSIFAYKRVLDNEELLVVNNFYGKDAPLDLDVSGYEVLLSNYSDAHNGTLRPYEAVIYYKK